MVHRSQKDPLQADEESAQRVFVSIDTNPTQSEVHSPTESKQEATATQKSAQNDYGIFFDDDYDYMQHLRSRTGRDYVPATGELIEKEKQKKSVKIHLPEDVLPSEREEDVGLLNKAAPIVGMLNYSYGEYRICVMVIRSATGLGSGYCCCFRWGRLRGRIR